VEGAPAPVVAQAGNSATPQSSLSKPQKPEEASTWSRVKTYFRKLWSPST
jgi:hypothetical protein